MLTIITNIPTILASIGMILATSSFISGLQLVKGTVATFEGKIHRFNGYASVIIYTTLFIMGLKGSGLSLIPIAGWVAGALLIVFKLWVVRLARRKRRAFKYISWLGATLTLMWLYIVYVHLPL